MTKLVLGILLKSLENLTNGIGSRLRLEPKCLTAHLMVIMVASVVHMLVDGLTEAILPNLDKWFLDVFFLVMLDIKTLEIMQEMSKLPIVVHSLSIIYHL